LDFIILKSKQKPKKKPKNHTQTSANPSEKPKNRLTGIVQSILSVTGSVTVREPGPESGREEVEEALDCQYSRYRGGCGPASLAPTGSPLALSQETTSLVAK
jgi:hypothetical protein